MHCSLNFHCYLPQITTLLFIWLAKQQFVTVLTWSDRGESAVTCSSITCKWMSCIISTRIFINPLSKKKSLQIDKIRLNKTPDKWKLSPSGSWHWLNSEAYIGYLTLFFSVNEKTITSTKTTGCAENNFHLEMFIKDNHLRLNPINVEGHWHIKLALYTGFINSHKTYHPRHNQTMNFWSLHKKALLQQLHRITSFTSFIKR